MEDGWVRGPMRKMMQAFNASLKLNPPIPPGVGDEYQLAVLNPPA
jgi:arylsulfatase